jgi:transmembrane sensor
MTDRIGCEDAGLQRMEQATLWLQRMRTSGQDDRVVDAWLDWCQRDPLNQQAFDEIAAIWEITGEIPRESVAPQRAAIFSRRALVASLAAVGIAGIAGAAWWNGTRDTVLTSQFTSPIGINTVQKLADGSVLTLGGGTRVAVTIGPKERRVDLLQGEVFAAVHHDTHHRDRH